MTPAARPIHPVLAAKAALDGDIDTSLANLGKNPPPIAGPPTSDAPEAKAETPRRVVIQVDWPNRKAGTVEQLDYVSQIPGDDLDGNAARLAVQYAGLPLSMFDAPNQWRFQALGRCYAQLDQKATSDRALSRLWVDNQLLAAVERELISHVDSFRNGDAATGDQSATQPQLVVRPRRPADDSPAKR